VSWLDIFALHAAGPVRFIAKAEIERWPVLGRLVGGVGTLFIERARRHDTHRVNQRSRRRWMRGTSLRSSPRLRRATARACCRSRARCCSRSSMRQVRCSPLRFRYRTRTGLRSTVPAYVDDVTFVGSFWRVSGAAELVVDIVAAKPLPAQGKHRRELAQQAEEIIRSALASPWSGSAPGRPAGLASELP
jgi:1-acyl-sn-glycerol-3-phosphate acyltransferase